MNKLFTLLVILTSLFSTTLSASEILVDDAWIREAPPVSKVQAAYMALLNSTKKDISLVSVSSPLYSHIEFHRTEMTNGVMRMQQQDTLHIPANSQLYLQPDGIHMMLFNPAQPLKAGDKVPFIFSFSDKKIIEVIIKVEKAKASTHKPHRCGGH